MLTHTGHIKSVFALWLPFLFAVFITVADHMTPDGVTRDWLYAEHGVNETIQWIIAFAAVYFGVSAALVPHAPKWQKAWAAVAALGCLYIGLEEISYGQQFFNWNTPEFWSAVNDQNETNFHNTSSWADQKPRAVLMLGIIVGGLIFPLLRRTKPNALPAQFNTIYPSADLKWIALLTLLSYLSKVFYKVTHAMFGEGIVIYDRPSEINETYIYLFMLLYLVQLRWQMRNSTLIAND